MDYNVLGLGYLPSEYKLIQTEWKKQGVQFEFSAGVEDAIERIRQQEYAYIVIRADALNFAWLEPLRSISSVPLVIMPSLNPVEDILFLTQKSNDNWKQNNYHWSGNNTENECDGNLTIRKFKDMRFCLEYRTVEIRKNEIELTEKEFDILSLLLINPKKVFSYEMIIDAVWHEAPTFYSSKTVSTHISNLRRKLKIEPDIPEYIKSVRGIGYKFEIPE